MDNRFRVKTTATLALWLGQCITSSLPLHAHAQSNVTGERSGGSFRERLRENLGKRDLVDCTKFQIAGLDVAAWKPSVAGKAPLVIFSHGFGGSKTQSASIMKAMAEAGYLVIAPNHRDADGSTDTHYRPQVSFSKFNEWSDKTYIDRHDDIVNLIRALHADTTWDKQIDWAKIALCGHSLGGYTVLGLAGAWPSWKIPGIKAVIALSPYTLPFTFNKAAALDNLQTPVMYQGGTKDFGITPFVKKPGGAYSKTSSPACFVEFDQFNHFSWTNFNRDAEKQNETNYYCVAFLDKYLKGDDGGRMGKKLPGVVAFEAK
ncbi:hypothetical protein BH10CYA1_BH10CYA1_19780 [soil metagenome]